MSVPVPVFTGVIDGRGRLTVDRPVDWGRWLMSLAGVRIEAIVRRRKRETRSEQAHKYLWVVYTYIADEAETTKDAIHDLMKRKFLGVERVRLVNKRTGEVEEDEVVRSTTKLPSDEFYRYVENVRLFAAEWLGLVIPDPEPGLLKRRAA